MPKFVDSDPDIEEPVAPTLNINDLEIPSIPTVPDVVSPSTRLIRRNVVRENVVNTKEVAPQQPLPQVLISIPKDMPSKPKRHLM